jgi:hypothetical protein
MITVVPNAVNQLNMKADAKYAAAVDTQSVDKLYFSFCTNR